MEISEELAQKLQKRRQLNGEDIDTKFNLHQKEKNTKALKNNNFENKQNLNFYEYPNNLETINPEINEFQHNLETSNFSDYFTANLENSKENKYLENTFNFEKIDEIEITEESYDFHLYLKPLTKKIQNKLVLYNLFSSSNTLLFLVKKSKNLQLIELKNDKLILKLSINLAEIETRFNTYLKKNIKLFGFSKIFKICQNQTYLVLITRLHTNAESPSNICILIYKRYKFYNLAILPNEVSCAEIKHNNLILLSHNSNINHLNLKTNELQSFTVTSSNGNIHKFLSLPHQYSIIQYDNKLVFYDFTWTVMHELNCCMFTLDESASHLVVLVSDGALEFYFISYDNNELSLQLTHTHTHSTPEDICSFAFDHTNKLAILTHNTQLCINLYTTDNHNEMELVESLDVANNNLDLVEGNVFELRCHQTKYYILNNNICVFAGELCITNSDYSTTVLATTTVSTKNYYILRKIHKYYLYDLADIVCEVRFVPGLMPFRMELCYPYLCIYLAEEYNPTVLAVSLMNLNEITGELVELTNIIECQDAVWSSDETDLALLCDRDVRLLNVEQYLSNLANNSNSLAHLPITARYISLLHNNNFVISTLTSVYLVDPFSNVVGKYDVGEWVLEVRRLNQSDELVPTHSACDYSILAVRTDSAILLLHVSANSVECVARQEAGATNFMPIGTHCVVFVNHNKLAYLCADSQAGTLTTLPDTFHNLAVLSVSKTLFVYLDKNNGKVVHQPIPSLLEPLLFNLLSCATDLTARETGVRELCDMWGRKGSAFPHQEGQGIGTIGIGFTTQVYKVLLQNNILHILQNIRPPWLNLNDILLDNKIPVNSENVEQLLHHDFKNTDLAVTAARELLQQGDLDAALPLLPDNNKLKRLLLLFNPTVKMGQKNLDSELNKATDDSKHIWYKSADLARLASMNDFYPQTIVAKLSNDNTLANLLLESIIIEEKTNTVSLSEGLHNEYDCVVAYYRFDETRHDSKLACDISPHNTHCEINGKLSKSSSPVDEGGDRVRELYDLSYSAGDSTNLAIIDVPAGGACDVGLLHVSPPRNKCTIEFWFRTDLAQDVTLLRRETLKCKLVYALTLRCSGELVLETELCCLTTILDEVSNTWCHVTLTLHTLTNAQTSTQIYFNGSMVLNGVLNTNLDRNTDTHLVLGYDVLDLAVTELRVWNRVRSEEEVCLMMREYLPLAEQKKKFVVKINKSTKKLVAPKSQGLLRRPRGAKKKIELDQHDEFGSFDAQFQPFANENDDTADLFKNNQNTDELDLFTTNSGGKHQFDSAFGDATEAVLSETAATLEDDEETNFSFASSFAETTYPATPTTTSNNLLSSPTYNTFTSSTVMNHGDHHDSESANSNSSSLSERTITTNDIYNSTLSFHVITDNISKIVGQSAAAAVITGPPASPHFGASCCNGLVPSHSYIASSTGESQDTTIIITGGESLLLYNVVEGVSYTLNVGFSGAIVNVASEHADHEYLCCFDATTKHLVLLSSSDSSVMRTQKLSTNLNYWRYLPPCVHGNTLVFMFITPIGAFHWMPLNSSDSRPRRVWKRSMQVEGKSIVHYEEGGSNGCEGPKSRSIVGLLLTNDNVDNDDNADTPVVETVEAWIIPLGISGEATSTWVGNVLGAALFRPNALGIDGNPFKPLVVSACSHGEKDNHIILQIEKLSKVPASLGGGSSTFIKGGIISKRDIEIPATIPVIAPPEDLSMGLVPKVLILCLDDHVIAVPRDRGLILAFAFENQVLVSVGTVDLNLFIVDAMVRPGDINGEVEVVVLLSDTDCKDGKVVVVQVARSSF